MTKLKKLGLVFAIFFLLAASAQAAFSLVMTNGYGDVYRMNLLRDRSTYQAYRGVCSYRGFALSGCSTTGEVVMLRIMATPTVPEYFSILSTSLRWGTTMYVLNDVFRPLNSTVMSGYENWYPYDMSCSVAMYINSGGFGRSAGMRSSNEEIDSGEQIPDLSDPRMVDTLLKEPEARAEPRTAFSLVMTNGYGDVYRMNLLRDRSSYQAYRGTCSYRGFSLSGCSTTGEVVMLRIMATATMPEHFSIVSTSLRWGTSMYFLNDVFRWINSTTLAGYENWYPFDMSCSVAMYVSSGGFGRRATPRLRAETNPYQAPGGTNVIGALLALSGDLQSKGQSQRAACEIAFAEITNTPGMPPFRLLVEDTMTDPHVALAKLQQFYTQGVQVVIGPHTSAEAEALLEFANEHGMLLLASASTATRLAITNDHLMRPTMDDAHQARQLAQQIIADGITNLALLARSDIYGEDVHHAFVQNYTNMGGHLFLDSYLPRIPQFLPEVMSNVNGYVSAQIALTGTDSLGLLMIVFDEGQTLLQSAATHTNLLAVRWYGTDGFAGDMFLMTNAPALQAARQTQLICSQPADFTNQLFATVGAAIESLTGEPPRSYSLHTYDSLWLAALALRDTAGTGTVADVRQAIRTNAATFAGATGPIIFNGADDRDGGDYAFIKVTSSNTWADITNVPPDAPTARPATRFTADGFIAAWASCAGATNYVLDIALDDQFTTFFSTYSNAPMGLARTHALTNLTSGQWFYYRIRAENETGSSIFSEIMSIRIPCPLIIPQWLLLTP
ncbi:MAG: amino acid ABC transporter substrate-binding protein [Spartobacteria bacterium]|nr:amino acid ABC transporter substrate-binding protein [Spartobacteria bacterium]